MTAKIRFTYLLIFLLLPAISVGQTDIDKKMDAALSYYYNGQIQDAKTAVQELVSANPRDPFFRELLAEIIWKELEKSVSRGQAPGKRISYSGQKNQNLAEQFYREIYTGLTLTQEGLDVQPADVKNTFLRGMLLIRKGGFIAKFESGIKSYAEADAKTAEGLGLLQKSIELDARLCSARAFFALAKHSLIRGADESLLNSLAIRWKSSVYRDIGSNFNKDQMFEWLDESMACSTEYYWTKDVMIDKKFIYQDILTKEAGRMDDKVLPVLEELSSYFPDNKVVRDNLFLVRLHVQNRRGPPR